MINFSNKKYLSTRDFLVTGEPFDLHPVAEGDMLVTHPFPAEADLPKYYQSEEYISHTDKNHGLMASLYQKVKRLAIRQKTKLATRLNNGPGTLLDIGAGTGAFLKACASDGWNVSGTEPNQAARNLASEKGLTLVADLSELDNLAFDVVTLWHVLEHIPNLEEAISDISERVRPGGHLILAVPNYKSYDANFYKSHWAAYDVPRHLWHFSHPAIERLFAKNFRLKKKKPMLFDSFYVSLLSEKYQRGTKFSLRALLVGGYSNVSGLFTGEYSSHIYILERRK